MKFWRILRLIRMQTLRPAELAWAGLESEGHCSLPFQTWCVYFGCPKAVKDWSREKSLPGEVRFLKDSLHAALMKNCYFPYLTSFRFCRALSNDCCHQSEVACCLITCLPPTWSTEQYGMCWHADNPRKIHWLPIFPYLNSAIYVCRYASPANRHCIQYSFQLRMRCTDLLCEDYPNSVVLFQDFQSRLYALPLQSKTFAFLPAVLFQKLLAEATVSSSLDQAYSWDVPCRQFHCADAVDNYGIFRCLHGVLTIFRHAGEKKEKKYSHLLRVWVLPYIIYDR